jgi:hypothetical protein
MEKNAVTKIIKLPAAVALIQAEVIFVPLYFFTGNILRFLK